MVSIAGEAHILPVGFRIYLKFEVIGTATTDPTTIDPLDD